MNGETLQACRIVIAARHALKEKKPIKFNSIKYENSVVFEFLPMKTIFTEKSRKAHDVNEWFQECISRELVDIKLLMPLTVKDRGVLGFSNSSQNTLVCFYKNGMVTYFTSYWEYDSSSGLWDCTYTEHLWENPPQGIPIFDDNTDGFIKVLEKIKILAHEINCVEFADIFANAQTILIDGTDETSEIGISLPIKNYNLFMAASTADVFGAMGSWNDSPPYMAHEKGLDSLYNELSEELLKQQRLAIQYAVNQW